MAFVALVVTDSSLWCDPVGGKLPAKTRHVEPRLGRQTVVGVCRRSWHLAALVYCMQFCTAKAPAHRTSAIRRWDQRNLPCLLRRLS
jgi:hypothetical protein